MAKVSIAGIFLPTSMPIRAAGSMLVYFTVSAFSPFDFMKASITFWVKLPAPLAISRFSKLLGLGDVGARAQREDRIRRLLVDHRDHLGGGGAVGARRDQPRDVGERELRGLRLHALDRLRGALARDDRDVETRLLVVALVERDVPGGVAAERAEVERESHGVLCAWAAAHQPMPAATSATNDNEERMRVINVSQNEKNEHWREPLPILSHCQKGCKAAPDARARRRVAPRQNDPKCRYRAIAGRRIASVTCLAFRWPHAFFA